MLERHDYDAHPHSLLNQCDFDAPALSEQFERTQSSYNPVPPAFAMGALVDRTRHFKIDGQTTRQPVKSH